MRRVGWGLVAVLGVVATVGACDSGETTEALPGAGSAGVSGKGGKGGNAGKAGTPSNTGGTGGAGGSGSAGTAGDVLVWTEAATYMGCHISVGLPSPRYQLFSWRPCEGLAECEEAEWTFPAPLGDGWRVIAILTDDENGERLVLNHMSSVESSLYFTAAAGETIQALSTTDGALMFSALHAGRFAVGVFEGESESTAVVSGDIGSTDLVVWTPPSRVSELALGAKRFVYRVAFSGVRSLDAETGGDYRVLTSESTGVLDVYHFDKLSPERFLFEAILPLATAPSGTTRTILVGDGVEPPAPWLAPEDQGEDATVRFAGSHVAWLRGYGQQKLNWYERVETWAAELDAAGNPVNPRVIETAPGFNNATPAAAAGHGRFAVFREPDRARVCELTSAACRDVPFPSGGGNFYQMVGITDTHLWVSTTSGRRMFRLKL